MLNLARQITNRPAHVFVDRAIVDNNLEWLNC